MIVNEVRDFAISLHNNDIKFDGLSHDTQLTNFRIGRCLFRSRFTSISYHNFNLWWEKKDEAFRHDTGVYFDDFAGTSSQLRGYIYPHLSHTSPSHYPSLGVLIKLLVDCVHSDHDLFSLNRRSIYLNSLSDGQLLAIYWYLLGH